MARPNRQGVSTASVTYTGRAKSYSRRSLPLRSLARNTRFVPRNHSAIAAMPPYQTYCRISDSVTGVPVSAFAASSCASYSAAFCSYCASRSASGSAGSGSETEMSGSS